MLFVILCLTFAAANGVVIATEKKLPSILVDEASVSLFLVRSPFVHYLCHKLMISTCPRPYLFWFCQLFLFCFCTLPHPQEIIQLHKEQCMCVQNYCQIYADHNYNLTFIGYKPNFVPYNNLMNSTYGAVHSVDLAMSA